MAPLGHRPAHLHLHLRRLAFRGGETTFFLPSVKDGVLNAYPVKPVMGSVAVFPHGEAQDALLHEGTGVVEGAKYVIRTDVEYDVDAGIDAE